MEAIPRQIRAYDEAKWQEALSYAPKVSKLHRQIDHGPRHSPSESAFHAAYFLAGRLYTEGFSLFQNGGQPLLKRHREDWTDEIIFRSPPTDVAGFYSPVAVEIIVSLESVKAVRGKYCRSSTMIPSFIGMVNIGEFELPPCKILWNLEDETTIEQIATLVCGHGIDWLEALSDPVRLEELVIARRLPHVDDTTGLEMVLALGGRNSAARVVREWLDDPDKGPQLERHLRDLSHTFGPVFRGDDPAMNLAVLCVCYDLVAPTRLRRRN